MCLRFLSINIPLFSFSRVRYQPASQPLPDTDASWSWTGQRLPGPSLRKSDIVIQLNEMLRKKHPRPSYALAISGSIYNRQGKNIRQKLPGAHSLPPITVPYATGSYTHPPTPTFAHAVYLPALALSNSTCDCPVWHILDEYNQGVRQGNGEGKSESKGQVGARCLADSAVPADKPPSAVSNPDRPRSIPLYWCYLPFKITDNYL